MTNEQLIKANRLHEEIGNLDKFLEAYDKNNSTMTISVSWFDGREHHDAKIKANEISYLDCDVFKSVIKHKEFLEKLFKEI